VNTCRDNPNCTHESRSQRMHTYRSRRDRFSPCSSRGTPRRSPSCACPSPPSARAARMCPIPRMRTETPSCARLGVDKNGSVVNAVAIEGAEPFAEQARLAVLAWRFAPAHRGDAPVAARIRARVEFHQELAPKSGSAVGPPATGSGFGPDDASRFRARRRSGARDSSRSHRSRHPARDRSDHALGR